MTDEEFVLEILSDGQGHTGTEINARSVAKRHKTLTLHSRIASLRDDGHIIRSQRVKGTNDYAYFLEGKQDAPSRVRPAPPEELVTAYIFKTEGEHELNGRFCVLLERVPTEPDMLEPAFKVEFAKGRIERAWSSELSPWYPVRE